MTPRQQGNERGQALPSVVAVVSVIAIVVAMIAFFAGDSDDQTAQPQSRSAEPTPRPTPSGTQGDQAGEASGEAEEAAEADGEQTAARTPRREQADKNKRGERAKRQQKRQDRPEPQTGPPDVYVEVYNNTTISGLAAATAAELQDAGWQVVGVDNWHGDIPASTVYYPAGLESEAQQLAETLGFGRVRGAVAPMKFDRLTVILTPDAA